MDYDINFCTPPNWQRESSINPNFILAVVLSVFFLMTYFLYTRASNRVQKLESVMNTTRGQIDAVTPAVQELRRLQQETGQWQEMLDKLQQRSENRHFWSRQLEALQGLVTANIIINNLSVRDESVRVEIPPPDPPAGTRRTRRPPTVEHYTVYHLHIAAMAFGGNVEQQIADFADNIGNCQVIGEKLRGYEIRNISSPSGVDQQTYPNARTFVLECTYKRIPEIR